MQEWSVRIYRDSFPMVVSDDQRAALWRCVDNGERPPELRDEFICDEPALLRITHLLFDTEEAVRTAVARALGIGQHAVLAAPMPAT